MGKKKHKDKAKRSEGLRPRWNKPTMRMLVRELSVTTNEKERAIIKHKMEQIRAYLKTNPETVTFYPNRKKAPY